MVEEKTTVVQAATKGGVSAVMPYVAIGVLGYVALKKMGDIDLLGGMTESGGAIIDRGGAIIDRASDVITKAGDTITNTYTTFVEEAEKASEKIVYGGEVAYVSGSGIPGVPGKVFVKKNLSSKAYPGLPAGTYVLPSKQVQGLGGKESISVSPDLTGFRSTNVSKANYYRASINKTRDYQTSKGETVKLAPGVGINRFEAASNRVDAYKASKASNRKTVAPKTTKKSTPTKQKVTRRFS